jgi:hypothetical protein
MFIVGISRSLHFRHFLTINGAVSTTWKLSGYAGCGAEIFLSILFITDQNGYKHMGQVESDKGIFI